MNRSERRRREAITRQKDKERHAQNMAMGMGADVKRTQRPVGSAFATFKQVWEDYNDTVYSPHEPPAPSSRQYIETRRAFYAGAQGFLKLISSQLDPEFDPTEDDQKRMLGWDDELQQFAQDVLKGKA